MKLESSLRCSQQPATCHSPEPDEFIPRPPTTSLRSILILFTHLRLDLASLLGCEAVSFGETCCCQLEGFFYSPLPPLSERLLASSAVRIHYISCQSDENRTHVPLFNIHVLSEWRLLSLWNLDEGRELRNAYR
jgi:hypothetical protein